MNGRDIFNSVLEVQKFDFKNQAKLEKIYVDERKKLNFDNDKLSYQNSPFIQISSKPAKFVENQITLTDSQFEKLLQMIERKLK